MERLKRVIESSNSNWDLEYINESVRFWWRQYKCHTTVGTTRFGFQTLKVDRPFTKSYSSLSFEII